jgi:hypothetical protein
MHQLVRAALRRDLGLTHPVPTESRALFRNLNTPQDLADQPEWRNESASTKLIQFIEDLHLQPFPLARFLGEMSDTENRKKNSPAKATHEEQNLSPGKQPPMNLDVVHEMSFC